MGAQHTVNWLYDLSVFLHLHISDHALEVANHVLRKSGHFIGYGVLGVLFFRAWMNPWPGRLARGTVARALALAVFCTFLVASADEFHQRFLPNRTASPWDVALDTAGAVVLTSIALPRLRRAS